MKLIERLGNHINTIKHFVIALDLLFVFLLLLNYYGYLPAFWNITYIFYIVLAFNVFYYALKIKAFPETLRDNLSVVYLSKYFFLLTLIIFVVNQFLKRAIITQYMPYLTGFSIAFGFLTFYSSRERVEREIEDEKSKEESDEKKRKEEFSVKFPVINRVWGVRSLVKRMYKEGWWYSGLLIAIVVLGFVLRIWNLGYLTPAPDEYVGLLQGKRFMLEGHFDNPQAKFLGYIIGFLFILNKGTSLFLARLPIVLFGTASVFAIYFLGRKINKKVGVISSYLLAFSPLAVGMSRYIREYEPYLLFLMLSLLLIDSLTKKSFNDRKQTPHPKKYFMGIILYFTTLVLYFFIIERALIIIYLLLFSLIFLFLEIKYIAKRGNLKIKVGTRFILFCLFIGVFLIYGLYAYSGMIKSQGLLNANGLYNEMMFNPSWNYWDMSLQWFSNNSSFQVLLWVLFFSSILSLYKNKNFIKFILCFCMLYFGIVYISSRYFAPRYIYYIFPFYILIFASSMYLFEKIKYSFDKIQRIIYLLALIAFLFLFFSPLTSLNGLLKEKNNQVDTKTGLPHYDLESLFIILNSDGFNNSEMVIPSTEGIFTYYYNYGFIKNPKEWPLGRFDYQTDIFGKLTDKLAYDYGKLYAFDYRVGYTHQCKDNVCYVDETDRINQIMSIYPSGWIVLDKDRNRINKKDKVINWNYRGFPTSNFTVNNTNVTYLGSTPDYMGFDVYKWNTRMLVRS